MEEHKSMGGAQDEAAPVRPVAGTRNLILGLLAAVLVFAGGFAAFQCKPYSELPLYRKAGERMRHGEPIYRTTERAFTYPPLFAVPFVALARMPEWTHRPLWYAVNCAALALTFFCLVRRLRPGLAALPGRPAAPAWLFWILVLVLAGRHILSPLENQSHDLLVFLCVMLAIDAACALRYPAAGFLAGLGTALKATPLLFAPVFLWQRRFAAAAVLVLSLAALMFLPDLLFPARDGASWTISWHRTFLTAVQPGDSASSTAWTPWNQMNQSVAGTLYRLSTPLSKPGPDRCDVCLVELKPAARQGVTLAGQLIVLAWLLWVSRRRLTEGLPDGERIFLKLGQGAALVTAMILLSPTSIKTHFCVLLLPIAFCLADFLYRRRDRIVGTALALSFLLGTLTVKGVVGRSLGDRIMSGGSLTVCALALFLATGRVVLQRSRASQELPADCARGLGARLNAA